jgi:hypothetical protein
MQEISGIAEELLASQRLLHGVMEWESLCLYLCEATCSDGRCDIQYIIVIAVWNSAQFTGVKLSMLPVPFVQWAIVYTFVMEMSQHKEVWRNLLAKECPPVMGLSGLATLP